MTIKRKFDIENSTVNEKGEGRKNELQFILVY